MFELCNRGRVGTLWTDAALAPLPFNPGRFVLDLDLEEERVVGGDDLSNHEFRVEDDLFGRSFGSPSPSLLEFPEDVPFSCVRTDILDRLRMESRNDGISSSQSGVQRLQRPARF